MLKDVLARIEHRLEVVLIAACAVAPIAALAQTLGPKLTQAAEMSAYAEIADRVCRGVQFSPHRRAEYLEIIDAELERPQQIPFMAHVKKREADLMADVARVGADEWCNSQIVGKSPHYGAWFIRNR